MRPAQEPDAEHAVITTVTLSPAIDEAVEIDEFTLGGQNRCDLDALDAGGKGINASRVLHRLGRKTVALGFVGGVTGQLIRQRLDDEHVLHAFDELSGLTRLNVMIYERKSGRSTRLYLRGAAVEPRQLDALKVRLAQVHAGALVIMGGSVPPGVPDGIYAEIVTWLHGRGVRSIVDTSGRALAAVLAARPLLIKPNVEEAEEVLGIRLHGEAEIVAAARELRARGAENVVISRGIEGAVAVGPDGEWTVTPPPVVQQSTVGAGDSMVAGLAIAFNEGAGLLEGLRLGTAAGAATVMSIGTHLCAPGDAFALLDRVHVRPIEKLAAVEER